MSVFNGFVSINGSLSCRSFRRRLFPYLCSVTRPVVLSCSPLWGIPVKMQVMIERERAASARPRGVLALVGAWGKLEGRDVDALIADIYARQEEEAGRRVEIEG